MVANSARNAGKMPVHAQTNMFIAGVLAGRDFSSPARIRNMSRTSALIESAVAPSVDTTVRLVRGSLEAEGKVVWSAAGRCGIRFSSSIRVEDWMQRAANGDQQRIDRSIALLQAGVVPLDMAFGASTRPDAAEAADALGMIGSDLDELARLLDSLGTILTQEEDVVRHYGTRLQSLDIAIQSLAVLREVAARHDELGDELVERLNNLRRSRREALAASSAA